MKTILSGVKTWTRGEIRKSTADWGQNDPNADNYVKNRTHWEEDVEISVIPKQQTTVFYPYVPFEDDVGFDPEEGVTYIVTFNGTRYELTAWHSEEYDQNFIGNRLYLDGVDDGSNIPFAFDGYVINAPHGVYTISISTLVDGIETEVIEEQTLYSVWTWDFGDVPLELGNVYSVNFDGNIYEFTATEYHYDPSIVAIGDVTQYPFEIIYADEYLILASTATGIHDISLFNVTSGAQTLTKSCIGYCPFYDNIDNFNLEAGQTYTVVWDDEVYSCTAKNIGEDGACIGNLIYAYVDGWDVPVKNTNEPFLIATDGNFSGIYLDSKESHTVYVFTTKTVVHKLDSKYLNLPENLATTDNIEEVWAYADGKMNKSNPQGTGSFSMNRRPQTAIGAYSHAEGYNATANGYCSHAEGQESKASGYCSHAAGYNTTASGDYSHTEGYSTKASGNFSHAEGYETTASNKYSHAEGNYTTASGEYSHAEGYHTNASGDFSHAEGQSAYAEGYASHAEGQGTKAKGKYSHAEGHGTIASSECSHVQGNFNVEDTNNQYAHIVGNGTYYNPANIHTLDWSGNAWFAGNIYIGGTGQDDTAAIKVAVVPFPVETDEGKFLRVVNGVPTWVSIPNAEEATF